jgi:hypothetical protein
MGFPRVYDIALETISHGDGAVDRRASAASSRPTRRVTTLTLGELWAIPIMAAARADRESSGAVAARIAADRLDRNLAD